MSYIHEDQYETQEQRFGSLAGRSGVSVHKAPTVDVGVEVTYTFNEVQVKEILAAYVTQHFNKQVTVKDVHGEYRSASYASQFDHSPASCKFTVKTRG